ncbi:MAG TPA: hypothetical protein V6C76_01610 [Drouetiella sp.]
MDDQNYLIALVGVLLVFVLGCSVLFNMTKSQKTAIIGGALLSVVAGLLLKINGWL